MVTTTRDICRKRLIVRQHPFNKSSQNHRHGQWSIDDGSFHYCNGCSMWFALYWFIINHKCSSDPSRGNRTFTEFEQKIYHISNDTIFSHLLHEWMNENVPYIYLYIPYLAGRTKQTLLNSTVCSRSTIWLSAQLMNGSPLQPHKPIIYITLHNRWNAIDSSFCLRFFLPIFISSLALVNGIRHQLMRRCTRPQIGSTSE